MPISSNVPSLSTMNYVGQNDAPSAARNGAEDGTFSRTGSFVDFTKKLEQDMRVLGEKIKTHEEFITYLGGHINRVVGVITDLEVKYHSSTPPKDEMEDEDGHATVASIMKHETSAAAIFCHLKRFRKQPALLKDVVGVVATLAKVTDDNLSRLLSEYLGLNNMLALVCKTLDGVKEFQSYDKDGAIIKTSGLSGLGAAIGQTMDGRFTVFCLENLIPYVGAFIPDDPQRRLDLLKPTLPNGEPIPGFLGFAVNMIHIDGRNLYYLTTKGNGLRETLFYTLFSRLQVYQTRRDMLWAHPYISDGAISLDGGMIRRAGIYSLGTREEVDVKFPTTLGISYLPDRCLENEKQILEMKWKRDRLMEEMHREEAMLAHVKSSLEAKKQKFIEFMALSSPYLVQQTNQGRWTPR